MSSLKQGGEITTRLVTRDTTVRLGTGKGTKTTTASSGVALEAQLQQQQLIECVTIYCLTCFENKCGECDYLA